MTDAARSKMDGTSGTRGTALMCKVNPGPVGDGVNGTSGTGTAATGTARQAVVPLVPLGDGRTGPEKPSVFRAVPLVPLVPLQNGQGAPDLLAAFEAMFAAVDTPETLAEHDAGRDAFEERAAIREHDGGETREEAERAAAGEHGFADPAEFYNTQKGAMADPARLAMTLKEQGPMTQGAAASALGWGATRAWQAEDALWRRRLIAYDRHGRAALSEAWAAFERANDPMDPEAWR